MFNEPEINDDYNTAFELIHESGFENSDIENELNAAFSLIKSGGNLEALSKVLNSLSINRISPIHCREALKVLSEIDDFANESFEGDFLTELLGIIETIRTRLQGLIKIEGIEL